MQVDKNQAGNQVKLGEIPENLIEVEVDSEGQDSLPVSAVLRKAKLVQNGNAAKDVLSRGAVYVDGESVGKDFQFKVGDNKVLQAGKKKIARVIIK